MKRVRQCSQCSSVDLEQIGENEYRCRYCGSVQYGPAAATARSLGIPRPRALALSIIGIIVVILVGAGAWIMLVPPGSKTAPALSNGTRGSAETIAGKDENDALPLAEFSRVAEIPDSIGNVYFIGMYRNTGTVTIRQPSVTIVLYDRKGRKVASGRGYSIRGGLPPGEETPVRVLVMRPPEYARYEALHEPMRPFTFERYNRPKMSFRGVEIRKRRYGGYEVVGDILNAGEDAVEYVNIIATLIDGNGRMIGFGTAYLPERRLKGGDYGPFRINVITCDGVPRSCRLDYEARYAGK